MENLPPSSNPTPEASLASQVAYVLIIIAAIAAAVGSFIPFLGILLWFATPPAMAFALVVGIVQLVRGRRREVIILLVVALLVLPAWVYLSPHLGIFVIDLVTGGGARAPAVQP